MLDSKALTRIQSIILIVVIGGAASGGVAAYVLSSGEETSETIKIGILADLDGTLGKHIWQGSVLAVEELNSEGGLLGKKIEIFGEDHDAESGVDMAKVSTSLTRLITYHKVDFVLGYAPGEIGLLCQEIASEHKKIFIGTGGVPDEINQRVK